MSGKAKRSAASMSMWMGSALALVLSSAMTERLHAEIITGTIEDRVAPIFGAFFIRTLGDGVNSVQLSANFGYYTPTNRALGFNARYSGWDEPKPGSEVTNSDVAFVPNVLDPSQLGDVSTLTFSQFHLDEYVMAAAWSAEHPNPLVPTGLVVYRNFETGYYGVVRLDDMWGYQQSAITGAMAHMTWWFQTDGSGDFSAAPAPGNVALFSLMSGATMLRRRRAAN